MATMQSFPWMMSKKRRKKIIAYAGDGEVEAVLKDYVIVFDTISYISTHASQLRAAVNTYASIFNVSSPLLRMAGR